MFVKAVLADFPDLPEGEVLRRARVLRRAFFKRLSAAGVESRQKGEPVAQPAPRPVGGVRSEIESTGPKEVD
jgi:hypothetical protein